MTPQLQVERLEDRLAPGGWPLVRPEELLLASLVNSRPADGGGGILSIRFMQAPFPQQDLVVEWAGFTFSPTEGVLAGFWCYFYRNTDSAWVEPIDVGLTQQGATQWVWHATTGPWIYPGDQGWLAASNVLTYGHAYHVASNPDRDQQHVMYMLRPTAGSLMMEDGNHQSACKLAGGGWALLFSTAIIRNGWNTNDSNNEAAIYPQVWDPQLARFVNLRSWDPPARLTGPLQARYDSLYISWPDHVVQEGGGISYVQMRWLAASTDESHPDVVRSFLVTCM